MVIYTGMSRDIRISMGELEDHTVLHSQLRQLAHPSPRNGYIPSTFHNFQTLTEEKPWLLYSQ